MRACCCCATDAAHQAPPSNPFKPKKHRSRAMIELLVHRSNLQTPTAVKGSREPLGRAFAIRGRNLIAIQAAVQHVEVYDASNRLLSWAEDTTFNDEVFQKIEATALAAISSNWHLCKARNRWHRTSVLDTEDRKHVLYLVPCNHPALETPADSSTSWWPSSQASSSAVATTADSSSHQQQPQSQQHPCVKQLGTGRCIIHDQPIAYILDWMRTAHSLWQHEVVQQAEGFYFARYKLHLLVVTDFLRLQPSRDSIDPGRQYRSAVLEQQHTATANSSATHSRSSNYSRTGSRTSGVVTAGAEGTEADASSTSDGERSWFGGSSISRKCYWCVMFLWTACTAICVALTGIDSILQGVIASLCFSVGFYAVFSLAAIAVSSPANWGFTHFTPTRQQASVPASDRTAPTVQQTANPSRSIHEQQLQDQGPQHRQQEQQDRQSISCVVCMDAPRSVMLLPCKHFVLCDECWENVLVRAKRRSCSGRWARRAAPPEACCPVCRTKIETHISGVIMS